MKPSEAPETAILLIDVQERLAPAMPEVRLASIERAARIFFEAALWLGAKVAATEQYPEGLGRTIAPIASGLDAMKAPRFAKLSFSALGEPGLCEWLEEVQPKEVVVLGIEAHVCVFQTVRDLRGLGIAVSVPVDAVASRRDDHREVGLGLCGRAGATLTTTETLVFDWLGRAGTDPFRALSKVIR